MGAIPKEDEAAVPLQSVEVVLPDDRGGAEPLACSENAVAAKALKPPINIHARAISIDRMVWASHVDSHMLKPPSLR